MSARVVDDLSDLSIVQNGLVDTPTESDEPVQRPIAVPIGQLPRPIEDDPNELLKHRFLCRGGGMLLVGPTGIGKSSSSMQCMILWGLGRDCFGITPTRKLKSLLIQAENDDGDLAEMYDGVLNGLGLSPEERDEVQIQLLTYNEDAKSSDDLLTNTIRPLVEDVRPDLLWIDPALAYLGGESNSQEHVGRFLRHLLNPLIHEFECAAIVVHHTNKPVSGRDKPEGASSALAYLANGSAEWSNWPRAILGIRPSESDSVFQLHAAKRGNRLRWKNPDGFTPTSVKFIAHARGEGEIYWRPATNEELKNLSKPKGQTKQKGVDDVMTFVPWHGQIEKKKLIDTCNRSGIGLSKVRELIDQAVAEGKLHKWEKPRSNGPAEVWLGREPQQEGRLPEDLSNSWGCSPVNNPVNNNPSSMSVVVNDASLLIGEALSTTTDPIKIHSLPVHQSQRASSTTGTSIPACPITVHAGNDEATENEAGGDK